MMMDTLLETSGRYNDDDDYPFNPPDIPDRPWPEDEDDDDEEKL
jgi:hypothetical protein